MDANATVELTGVTVPALGHSGKTIADYGPTCTAVGFSNDQCKPDLAMRPYIILENGAGETLTLYGGIVERSIGYIAYQNRNSFSAQSEAYDFVWDIIHHVYGDQFDTEYKK